MVSAHCRWGSAYEAYASIGSYGPKSPDGPLRRPPPEPQLLSSSTLGLTRCIRLIGVNAVSLVFALAANLALFLNMARRIPFKIAQPVSILGFWFASVLLIALIAVAAHDFHAPGVRDQALTQAYYYAIFAAGLYQIISYLVSIPLTPTVIWNGMSRPSIAISSAVCAASYSSSVALNSSPPSEAAALT